MRLGIRGVGGGRIVGGRQISDFIDDRDDHIPAGSALVPSEDDRSRSREISCGH